jgi:hypothetical protein
MRLYFKTTAIFFVMKSLAPRLQHKQRCQFSTCLQFTHVKIWEASQCLELLRGYPKISHLVPSLSTSRQQVVFALLVPSCQQVWNKLLTICNNLVDIIRLVTRFFQQVRYCPIQSWYNSIVTTLCLQPCNILVYHDYIKHVRTTVNNLVTSLIMPSSLFNTSC